MQAVTHPHSCGARPHIANIVAEWYGLVVLIYLCSPLAVNLRDDFYFTARFLAYVCSSKARICIKLPICFLEIHENTR